MQATIDGIGRKHEIAGLDEASAAFHGRVLAFLDKVAAK
jgi:hypothetical protein